MSEYAVIPWNRYGLIAELADRLSNKTIQFGKTALQKMIYILQEGLGVDCGYRFDFYIYGPFTSQIFHDMDFVELSKGIEIYKENSGIGGYSIKPGEQSDLFKQKAESFLDNIDTKKNINKLIDDFGKYYAKDLELRATIIYVEREFTMSNKQIDSKSIAKTVSKIKPKFSTMEIEDAISELTSKKYIFSNSSTI